MPWKMQCVTLQSMGRTNHKFPIYATQKSTVPVTTYSNGVMYYSPFLSSPSPSQDFGDYSESFYSVQTTEGETISQLIAGYIDIIMQKKKPIIRDVPEDEDEPVIMDFEVDPKK